MAGRKISELKREPTGQEFDLQELDTVRIGVKRFRVTEISREGFAVREVMSDEEIRFTQRTPEVREFSKAEYLDGKTGIVKLEQIGPVKTYIDESLKRQKAGTMKRKPETACTEPEETAEGAEISSPDKAESAPKRTNTARAVSELGRAEKPPENDYLSAIDQIVCICKPYGSDDLIRGMVGDLTRMILTIGVDRSLTDDD